MNPALKLIRVEPIGKQRTVAFACGGGKGGLREVEMDIYPEHKRAVEFREKRVHEAGWSLREAAKKLGLSAAELSDLENGRKTLGDEDWARVEAMLIEAQS
jgi:hypothetical protein